MRLTKAQSGRNAGGLDTTSGYFQIRFQKITYQAHRIVYELMVGKIPNGMSIDHRDRNRANNKIDNIHATKLNNRNLPISSRNTSGICGVNRAINGWQAQWKDLDGKNRSKYFSIIKYGEDTSKRLAIKARVNAIQELNKLGANYTITHGLDT